MGDSRRKVMKEAVCLLVAEAGFTSASEESLETLTEMLIGCNLIFHKKFSSFHLIYICFFNNSDD